MLPEFYLKLHQGEIRSALNPLAQLLSQFFGQLACRTPFAALWPLDPPALAQRPHNFLRPTQTDAETPGQYFQAPVTSLICLYELPPQIV